MSTWIKVLIGGFVALGSVLLYVISLLAPIGSGYSAKYVCSQVFLAGRDPGQVISKEIDPTHPMFSLVSNSIDPENRTVTSVTFGVFSRTTAVYRDGFGCTLAVDATPEELRGQATGYARPRPLDPGTPWPRGKQARLADLVSSPDSKGTHTDGGITLDVDLMKAALDKAFSEPAGPGTRQSQAVAIVYKGRLVAERYAEGFNAGTPVLGWSMTKTITAALAGILVQDGKLDINGPAPVPEWKDDATKAKITPNDLLRMSSGLDFSEEYAPFKDAPEMLYAHGDMASYGALKPLKHAPGKVWYYSSADTNLVARIVRMNVGGTAVAAQRFARERMLDPIGMSTAIIEPDASGTFVGSSYMYASARDWARFGLLLARDGDWFGQRILPEGWVAYMVDPVEDAGGQYGAQTWLNAGRDNEELKPRRRFTKLKSNMFYLSGYNGQTVIILPDEDLIVVRLGVTHTDDHYWAEDLVVDAKQALGLD